MEEEQLLMSGMQSRKEECPVKYVVITPGEREVTVEASNSTAAKRMACKFFGIKPADPWCGVSAMTARKAGGKT